MPWFGCGISWSYSLRFETIVFANVPGALRIKNARKEINMKRSSAEVICCNLLQIYVTNLSKETNRVDPIGAV